MAAPAPPAEEVALERGLLTGVAAFRWPAWVWMTIVLALDARSSPPVLARPVVAVALDLAALAFTIWATLAVRSTPHRLLGTPALVVEGAIALGLAAADSWVYRAPHTQSLGSIWPLAWVLTLGIGHGGRAGAAGGAAVGASSWIALADWAAASPTDRIVGPLGTIVLYTLGGGVAGYVTRKLRDAERQIGMARAREEVARTLHDGVLQTLAVVQRRASDDDLVRLAREQELELREFLFGPLPGGRPGGGVTAGRDVVTTLRSVANRSERQHGIRCQVVPAGDVPPLDPAVVQAVAGAVSEALTNAAKHGEAPTATVFIEAGDDGGLFCSVKDTGRGFDDETTDEGVGLTRSVRGRIAEVGGRVEVDGRPGRGAEVRLWVP